MPVECFLNSLQNAYSSANFDLVLEHYHAPLAVVRDDITIMVENEWQLKTHIRRLLADQKLGRIQYFDTKLIQAYAVGDALTLVRYSLTAHYLDGTVELPTYAAFVLREVDGRLRITTSIATRSRWRDRVGISDVAAVPAV